MKVNIMKKIQDITVNKQTETLAFRLRQARDGKGLSRRAVKDATGISDTSIDRFENGSQEPTVSRLEILAKLYDVTVDWLLKGEEADEGYSLKGNEPILSDYDEQDEMEDEGTEKPAEAVRAMLSEIDDLRENGFEGARRYALALASDASKMMLYLEADELEELAIERELYQEKEGDGFKFSDLFDSNPHGAHDLFIGNVSERIADTAILGIDLYHIERDVLSELADQFHSVYRLTPKGEIRLTGWGDYEELVPTIRTAIRTKFVSSSDIDFSNLNEFSRR